MNINIDGNTDNLIWLDWMEKQEKNSVKSNVSDSYSWCGECVPQDKNREDPEEFPQYSRY